MNALGTIGQVVFNWTWKTSIQAGVLVILVLLLQRVLGRWLTPRLRYVLSLLVVCRLLLPIAPPSALSLENLLTPTTLTRPPNGTIITATAPVRTTSSPVHTVTTPLSLLAAIWFCGLLFLGGLGICRYCQWKRTIRAARQVSDTRLLQILDNVRQEVGICRPVTLASLADLGSPAVFGFWRVHLLLPESNIKLLNEQEWRLVFLHEMLHIRSYDTVLNILLICVQFLHWFNPLVWIGLQRLRADRELVCDALVVERLEASERLSYAQVLLRLAEALSDGRRVFPSVVPVVSGASEIKTRVTMIKHYRKSSRALRVGVVICILLLGFLTFTRARDDESQSEKNGPGSGLTGTTRGDVENQIIHEFRTAGYSLPEGALDDVIQEAIKNEFGDRTTLIKTLEDRGMTIKEFREQMRQRSIRERLGAQVPLTNLVITATGTNAVVAKYGPTTINSDRITVFPEQGKLVAEGHVIVQQKKRELQGLAWDAARSQAASEQKVHAIDIRYAGPKSVKETQVRRRIRAQVGKPLNTVEIDDDVRNLYATGLFYNVRVSTEPLSNGVDLVYNLQCNPRIAKVRFTGNSKLSDAQLQKHVRTKVGDVFKERQIFLDGQAIQKDYEHAGYPSTGVKYSFDIDEPTGKASVIFEVTEKN